MTSSHIQMKYINPDLEDTNESPEYEARKVLAGIQWDGTPPVDLINICEMNGISYVFRSDPEMEEPGRVVFKSAEDFFIHINTNGTDCENGFSSDPSHRRRQRFTFAHEIGHCFLKSHTNIGLQANLSDKNNPYSNSYAKKRESQASEFAAHLLIPRKEFGKFSRRVGWGSMLKLIEKTSEEFDVSLKVSIQQIAKLADYPCIAIIFKSNGMPERVPVFSDYFQETNLFYPRDLQVPPRSLARSVLESDNLQYRGDKKFPDTTIWFPDIPDWKSDKFSIKETSIKTGKYGAVTILEVMEK
jgi:IrrE N-terminal-like domain